MAALQNQRSELLNQKSDLDNAITHHTEAIILSPIELRVDTLSLLSTILQVSLLRAAHIALKLRLMISNAQSYTFGFFESSSTHLMLSTTRKPVETFHQTYFMRWPLTQC